MGAKGLTWFVKAHGLSRDYVVVDGQEIGFAISRRNVRWLCHRRRGVGADALILLMPSESAVLGARIYKADGEETDGDPEAIRVLAYIAYRHGYTEGTKLSVETCAGTVEASVVPRDGPVAAVSLSAGPARFPAEVGISDLPDDLIGVVLTTDHVCAVVQVPDLDWAASAGLRQALSGHAASGVWRAVHLVEVTAPDAARVVSWSSGGVDPPGPFSTAGAVAAGLRRLGLTERQLWVETAQGSVWVEVAADWQLQVAGPATEICAGQLSTDFLHRLA